MSDKKWTPDDAQRAVLLALQAEAAKESSVAEFCKQFATFTDSKFSKIMDVLDDNRKKSYFDEIKNPNGLMADLADWLKKIPTLRLEKESATQRGLYKLSKFRAVAVGIRECKKETSPERIVKFISPTGGSKTSLRRYLMEEFKNELAPAYVESREAWRPATRDLRQRAKLVVLTDIASALNLRFAKGSSRNDVAALEDDLITACMQTKRLLFIDEAEFFSSYALNLIKLLLNKSRLIVVIACTPRAHARWNSWYPDEADQISRRTRTVVSVSADDLVGPALQHTIEDAAQFFPPNQFANPNECLKLIVEQAWQFGHYSTIARVARELEKHTSAERGLVESAVRNALKQMAKERTGRTL